MSDFDRSNLLEFLHKPRCLREIVSHFEAPPKLVDQHLQAAIKAGRILVYRTPRQNQSLKLNTRQRGLATVVYIAKSSPLLAPNVSTRNQLPKTKGPAKESAHHDHVSLVFSEEHAFLNHILTPLRLGRIELPGVFSKLSSRMRLSTKQMATRRRRWKKRSATSPVRSLSHVERLCLFRTLSDDSLPFLDIHRRFGISKQTVQGFVRRGLFREVWGPRNIGVKYKLTEEGKAHLKRLEKAALLEEQEQQKIFIRLKQRVFPWL